MTKKLGRDDVEIIAKDTPFKGYFQIDRYTLRHRTFDGGWTQPMTREIFERGHAVVVVLFDPVREELAMIEQFRPGAYAAQMEPWLLECVAGIIEPDESPEQVALRESQEEAGITPSDLFYVGRYLITAGGSSESCWLYCGRIDSTQIGGLHGLAHEGEDIRAFPLPLAEALAMVRDGRINNSMAVISIQWLALELDHLKARWGI